MLSSTVQPQPTTSFLSPFLSTSILLRMHGLAPAYPPVTQETPSNTSGSTVGTGASSLSSTTGVHPTLTSIRDTPHSLQLTKQNSPSPRSHRAAPTYAPATLIERTSRESARFAASRSHHPLSYTEVVLIPPSYRRLGTSRITRKTSSFSVANKRPSKDP